jgi:hypothetical protein
VTASSTHAVSRLFGMNMTQRGWIVVILGEGVCDDGSTDVGSTETADVAAPRRHAAKAC